MRAQLWLHKNQDVKPDKSREKLKAVKQEFGIKIGIHDYNIASNFVREHLRIDNGMINGTGEGRARIYPS